MRFSTASLSLLLPSLAFSSTVPPQQAEVVVYYVAYETRHLPSRPTDPPAADLPQFFYLNIPKETSQAPNATAAASTATAPETTAGPDVLELREVVNNQGASLAASQYPSVTSYWIETVLPGPVTTWVQVFYTQSFAKVVSQAPSPAAGEIGMGTLTGAIGVVKTNQAKGAAPASMRLPGRGPEAWVWGGIWSIVGTLMGAAVLGARIW